METDNTVSTNNTRQEQDKSPPIHESRYKIPSDSAVLDSYIAWPKQTSDHSNVAIVVTHPYSLLGGNMENNVVYAVAHRLAFFGFTTIRFNFRGNDEMIFQN
jgi:hypothetical protein